MNRLAPLKKLLKKHSLDAALISSVPTITYLTGYANFSVEEREAFLFITNRRQFILTDGRYATAIKKEVPDFTLIEISSRIPFKQILEQLIEKLSIQTLGIEENDLRVHEYKTIKHVMKKTKHFSASHIRIQKNEDEIAAIQKACELGDKTFAYILKHLKPGMTELSIAWELEKYIKEHGADISFKPIVAFGANAAIPHHNTGNKKLSNRSLILLDFGVKIDNYCSDMTRTIFLGKAPEKEKHIYQTVREAQQKAINIIRHSRPDRESRKILDPRLRGDDKGVLTAQAVDQAARDYIIKSGYPSIPHSLGHGIGLEVHEAPSLSPVSKQNLENGMVFSIEPGIYIPDVAGVRIEDLFVIENGKLRQLTKSPSSLIEL